MPAKRCPGIVWFRPLRSRPGLAGSWLTAREGFFATGGGGSPPGPERREGAAKRLDANAPLGVLGGGSGAHQPHAASPNW